MQQLNLLLFLVVVMVMAMVMVLVVFAVMFIVLVMVHEYWNVSRIALWFLILTDSVTKGIVTF